MTETAPRQQPDTVERAPLPEEEVDPLRAAWSVPASFPELVLSHYDWRTAVARNRPSRDLERAYCQRLARFESVHGRIVNAYWCLNLPSAVALTAKPRPRLLRWLGRNATFSFHRATDWATKDKPEIAAKLHQCDEVAIHASEVLTGVRQRIALQLVLASASHLLSLADKPAQHHDPQHVLKSDADRLEQAARYYRDAANGQAQMTYFAGMAAFAIVIGLLAIPNALLHPLPDIDDREFFGTLFAGALGAVVSVVQRINFGRFDLEFDVGRPYPFFLGGTRPLMGGIFGLAFYFAVSSGLLDIIPIASEGTDRFYALVALAFIAGFSERWATDTLATAASAPPSNGGTTRDESTRPELSRHRPPPGDSTL